MDVGQVSTYSFSDVVGVINSIIGSFPFQGVGVGDLNVEMSTDKTVHTIANDGSIMISLIPGDNGVFTLNCLQNSLLNTFLANLYNASKVGGSATWASTSIYLREIVGLRSITMTGVSFQKRAGLPYQQQGQMRTWTFMAADIQEITA